MSIGSNIKTIRQIKGMSQEDLADAMGVTQAYISIYECGQRKPGEDVLNKIAKELGVSADLLKSETLAITANGETF